MARATWPVLLLALALGAGAAEACHPAAGALVYAGGYLDGAQPMTLRLSFPPCDGPVPVAGASGPLGGAEATWVVRGELTFLDGFHGCVSACEPLPPAAAFFLELDTPAEPSYFAGAYANPHYALARVLEGGFEGRPASLLQAQA